MLSLVPASSPDDPSLRWVFQPIVDLVSGSVLGHEVLTRTAAGGSPFELPLEASARQQLERECLLGALRRLGSLGESLPAGHFFVNTSHDVVCAPDFLELLQQAEVPPSLLPRLVLELTEHQGVADPPLLQQRLQQLAERGVRTALDDFGAGHSGLLTLVWTMPGYLKLDMALIRELHLHPYRQHLVRSLVAFAASVDAVLIAEGVEAWEELGALVALGVRHAQGYLVAYPAPLPGAPSPAFEARRARLVAEAP